MSPKRSREITPPATKPARRLQAKDPVIEREPWTPWGKWLKRRRERIERRRLEREERRRQKRRARQIHRIRRRVITTRGLVFLGLMLLACGVGMLVLMLLGRPYPWQALSDVTTTMRVAEQMEVRRERWEELAIHHYKIEVTYNSRTAQCGPYIMEVRSDQLVTRQRQESEHWFPAEICNALQSRFLIHNAFGWLSEELAAFHPGEIYLDAVFDPVLGYPTYAEKGAYDMEDAPLDCCWRITWANLRPTNP